MIKILARSIREYKKASILTPLLVTVEVILECAIPFVIANLVNQMQAGCSMDVIVRYGVVLIAMSAYFSATETAFTSFNRIRQYLRHRFYRLCA